MQAVKGYFLSVICAVCEKNVVYWLSGEQNVWVYTSVYIYIYYDSQNRNNIKLQQIKKFIEC